MITLFNVWHYLVVGIILLILALSIVAAFKQPNKKLLIPMIFSVTLVAALMLGFGIMAVDKYTKIVKLYKMENKRLLGIEKIVYTGIVKNEGNYDIGEVVFEIKLVNKGHATGNVKAGSFFSPSGFADFFGGSNILYKPQSITKKFVVAKNLRPGEAESFRVYFDYPPYFRSVAHFGSVTGR
ncbi:DUF2393 domain-containing protein [bacterium]|nr:DUF2393 domain-containing protein [bacterium]MBU1993296.1 DUF2393 domain-containing protein [bacterium]